MRVLIVLLVTLFSVPLLADIKFTLGGRVQSPDMKNDGVSVKVQVDNMWGCKPEDFEKFKRDNGPLPTVSLDVTATTDNAGAFSIECLTKIGPEGRLPEGLVESGGGRGGQSERSAPFVIVKVTATKPGFRGDMWRLVVSDGHRRDLGTVSMRELSTVSGSVIRLSDRKPQPDLKLRLHFPMLPDVYPDMFVTTNAAGKFSVEEKSVPLGPVLLIVDDEGWAFAASSVAWTLFQSRPGANDFGNLIVVPGGTVTGRVVHTDTSAALACAVTLVGTEQGSRIKVTVPVTAGAFEARGLPAGSYEAHVAAAQFWQTGKAPFKIIGGQSADLGDLALDPHRNLEVLANTEDGAGLEKYQISLTWVGGSVPLGQEIRQWPRPGPYTQRTLTAEKCVVEGLWSSKWLLQVSAVGYAPTAREVEIPKQSSITVALERGGAIRLIVQDEHGKVLQARRPFAVNQDSPSYKEAKDGTLQIGDSGELPAGVYRSSNTPRDDLGSSLIDPVAAGTYFVWALTDSYDRHADRPVRVARDNIKVEKGQTVEITLRPTPGRLTVNVTESGSPKSGARIYLTQLSWDGVKLVKEVTSGATGEAVFADLQPVKAVVLSKREYDWIGSLGRDAAMSIRDRLEARFKSRNVVVGWGDEKTLAFELADPATIWVTLEVKLTGGAKPDRGSVTSADADPTRPWDQMGYPCTFIDGKANLGPMPKGKYMFAGHATLNGDRVGMAREFEVTTPPEQTVRLLFVFQSVAVTVKPPKDVPAGAVIVTLAPASKPGAPVNEPWHGDARRRTGIPDEKGVVTFLRVDGGNWTVTAHASMNGSLKYAATKEVVVKGDTKVSLKFNESVGTINVRVSGNPAMGPSMIDTRRGRLSQQTSRAKVLILNDKEEPIEVGDPSFLFGVTNQPWVIPAVPTGNWIVVVAAHGLQPVRQKLKIEKDKAAALNVSPLPAAVAHFILAPEEGSKLELERFELTYEDSDGNAVPIWTPDDNWMTGGFTDNGKLQAIGLNVNDKVKKVRLRIEGYEDVVLDIEFEAGKTFVSEQVLKKKP